MANVTLPYTLANGNTADGGQVQQNFDAIVTQVNGNLDSDNLASGAVTLAKLATDVKVIENVYTATGGATIPKDETDVNIISQTITLTTARYCLFLATAQYLNAGDDDYGYYETIKDGTSTLVSFPVFLPEPKTVSTSNWYYSAVSFHHYGQLTAGTHTIYLTISTSNLPASDGEVSTARLTIIQFAF